MVKSADKAIKQQRPLVLRLFAGSWAAMMVLAAYLVGGLSPLSVGGGLLLAAAGCFAVGLVVPALMAGPYRLVERLLTPVGHLFSLLLLAVVYFTLFALFAVVLRLLGWDPLRLRRSRWPASGWVTRTGALRSAGYHWQY